MKHSGGSFFFLFLILLLLNQVHSEEKHQNLCQLHPHRDSKLCQNNDPEHIKHLCTEGKRSKFQVQKSWWKVQTLVQLEAREATSSRK